jgi:hypothetical protein
MNKIKNRIRKNLLKKASDYDSYTNEMKQFEEKRKNNKEYRFNELNEDVQDEVFDNLKDEISEYISSELNRDISTIPDEQIIEYINDYYRFFEDGEISFKYEDDFSNDLYKYE